MGCAIAKRLEQGAVIYPPEPLMALALTPLEQVKVVILGQDPYHGPQQAQGLAFSVGPGVKIPPSLRNIFKEVAHDTATPMAHARHPADPLDPVLSHVPIHPSQMRGGSNAHSGSKSSTPLSPSNGSLTRWAEQGVLLLNTCLTVENGQPASHAKLGWEVLTDKIIQAVWELEQPVVFMLWGAHAQSKQVFMTESTAWSKGACSHLVLTANHPSPLSALRPPQPYAGCQHFSKANQHLLAHGRSPIRW